MAAEIRTAIRASVVHCLDDPGSNAQAGRTEIIDDGLLLVADGHIEACGRAEALLPTLGEDVRIVDHRGRLVVPGFIDCHVHFPQLDVIASYGAQLLDWLQRYAFPGEMRLADRGYAEELADAFVEALLANGTTTALVFATVHPHSVDAILGAAQRRDMRLVAGKVLMDRNCPDGLRDDAESAYRDSAELIGRWHGVDRLGYAITPRFALTSSEAQLQAAGRLAAEHPDVWVHTHLAENPDEIAAVARQFPWSDSYLDVYAHFGLLRERSVFAHCLHLSAADRGRMARGGAAAAFCPTSNLFLGSGLFDLRAMADAGVPVGLATDVGGGTSLSMLRTMHAAYNVLQLGGQTLPAERALYLATLGAARALRLDAVLGNFAAGKEADFVVLDPAATAVSARRSRTAADVSETLFATIILGDDRHVAETWVNGRRR